MGWFKKICKNKTCAAKPSVGFKYCSYHLCPGYLGDATCHEEINKCYKHTCLLIGCTNKKSAEAHICSSHSCLVNNCMGSTSLSENYCKYHKCTVCGNLGSYNVMYDTILCHQHRCTNSDCFKEIMPGKKLCIDHGCEFEKCKNLANGLCKTHQCEIHDCFKEVKINSSKEISSRCVAHTCHDPECIANIYLNKFCKRHTCQVKFCLMKIMDGKTYCSIQHKCKTSDCDSHIFNKAYCQECGCGFKYCNLKNKKLPNNSKYCDNHTCKYSGCKNKSDDEHDLCKFHKCLLYKCQNLKTGNDYCFYHQCQMEGCTKHNLKNDMKSMISGELLDNYHYCDNHTCASTLSSIKSKYIKIRCTRLVKENDICQYHLNCVMGNTITEDQIKILAGMMENYSFPILEKIITSMNNSIG